MSWEFKPGMRVVCIHPYDSPREVGIAVRYGVRTPRKGVVYTIREVLLPEKLPEISNTVLPLRLIEIVNPPVRFVNGVLEPAFPSTRFRPLDESRLDVFRDLLVDVPKEEELV